jgi:hypothetical protein
METICFFETLVSTYKPSRRYNPEQQHRQSQCCTCVSFPFLGLTVVKVTGLKIPQLCYIINGGWKRNTNPPTADVTHAIIFHGTHGRTDNTILIKINAGEFYQNLSNYYNLKLERTILTTTLYLKY